MMKISRYCTKILHLRSFMSTRMQSVRFAAFFRFRYASLMANTLRDVKQVRLKFPALGTNLKKRSCQDMCRIVRFLRKSLTSEELSVKYKIKLFMEYFDSEA